MQQADSARCITYVPGDSKMYHVVELLRADAEDAVEKWVDPTFAVDQWEGMYTAHETSVESEGYEEIVFGMSA